MRPNTGTPYCEPRKLKMSALSWSLSSAVGQLSYSLTPLNKSSSGATITSQKKEAQFEILLLEELLSLVMAFYILVKKNFVGH